MISLLAARADYAATLHTPFARYTVAILMPFSRDVRLDGCQLAQETIPINLPLPSSLLVTIPEQSAYSLWLGDFAVRM